MKKIVLTAAALLAISGSAFAGNDNVGWTDINKQATATADSSHTASIQKSAPTEKQPVIQGSDRNLFGNN
ncbi:DUF680 domain-containing protein [Mesorhizobium huakuii]|uniref:DUF680 domain-containing protein n=1 Tax=Mesorhizobium huakuii TaxID=28104 RepID=A0ABZ0VH00_9HYPH|nr:DUF680 domain-containing protein [Mesorhizobium huakuii]WQB96253.1 DUF680 domain-containing protein [Mesorhizobium huakuii]